MGHNDLKTIINNSYEDNFATDSFPSTLCFRISFFTKPFALMIRLFANISAGHIIIMSLISLIFMAQSGLGNAGAFGVAPVSVLFVLFMYFIEVLVAFLQAYIFTLLTSLFIGLATVEHH